MATTKFNRPLVWLRRYLPAEALSVLAILCASLTTLEVTGNILLAALAGTWAEFLTYYGVFIVRALRAGGRITPQVGLITVRNLALEFGAAELLDSLLVRPAALAIALALLPNPALGALAGKLAADVVFYLPTILSFELLTRTDWFAVPGRTTESGDRTSGSRRTRIGSGVEPKEAASCCSTCRR
jgi:hypothetical protein